MNRPIATQSPAPHAVSQVADARIVCIETIPLMVKLDRVAVGSNLKFTHRHTIVTRVHTDAGVTGECFNGNDDDLQPAIIRVIADEMTPKLIGRQVNTIDKLGNSPEPRPSRSCAIGASRCARRLASIARPPPAT